MIGILGESMELAAQWLAKYKHIGPYRWVLPLETFFGITLCAGLAMGFLGSHRAKQIAGGQTTTLQQAVRQAEQAAAQANERAAANELTAKRLELQSVSIRKQLLDLQARASGRTISVEQATNLINRSPKPTLCSKPGSWWILTGKIPSVSTMRSEWQTFCLPAVLKFKASRRCGLLPRLASDCYSKSAMA